MRRGAIAVAGALCALTASGPQARGAEFDARTGTLAVGDKHLALGGTGFQINAQGARLCSAGYYFSTRFKGYFRERDLREKRSTPDPGAGRVEFSARIPLRKNGETATFASSVRPAARSSVRMTTRVAFERTESRALYRSGEIQVTFRRADLAGGVVRIGDREIRIPSAPPAEKGHDIYNGGAARMEFWADDPTRSIVITTIRGKNRLMYAGDSLASIEMRIIPVGDETEFVVELPESGIEPEPPSDNAWAGIDFLRRDGFRVPNFRLSRNLVQNPSFEAGLHCWMPGPVGSVTALDFDDFLAIDEAQAYRGTRSARLTIRKGETPPMLNHLAVPVVPEREYTFSFYAKADREGVKTSVLAVTQHWPNFPLNTRVSLTRDWKRYHFAVTAPNRILHIGIGERWWDEKAGDQIDGARIWVDCVQLEEGALSEYAEKPLAVELRTGKYGNVYEERDGKRMDLAIHNDADAERRVNATVTVRDFYGRQRHRETFSVTLSASETHVRALSLDGCVATGYYVASVDLDDGSFRDNDFFRFAVIRPLRNEHRHKNVFAGNGVIGRPMWWDRHLELLTRVGVGSTINWQPLVSKAHYDLLAAHGIRTLSCITAKDRVGGVSLATKETYTPEGLRRLEEAACEYVRRYPWETYWKLRNEPGHLPEEWKGVTWEEMVSGMAAICGGIKRANPQAKVISPDPCNMYRRGRGWLERYLQAGGLKTFDILAIHPYRATPEDPDLDADARQFLELADAHGFCGPIWWTEGIYYAPYTISELGLTAYKGCSSDFYRGGALSYDLGRSERIAAAWTARSFLVALKYGRRVDMSVDWSAGKYYFMDYEETMHPVMFAVNTLGNVLGNAEYRRDVDLGEGIRTYVFEDERRRPVAVIWNCDLKVNRFEKEPPRGVFPFRRGEITVVDFMMEPVATGEGDAVELPVTPYPVFLIGAPGTLDRFAARLEEATITGTELVPLRVATRVTGRRADITFQSLLSRGVKGSCEVLLGGRTVRSEPIDIKGKGEQHVTVDLSAQLRPDAIVEVPLAVRLDTGRGPAQTIDGAFRAARCPKRRRPIRIDGSLADWTGAPGIALGEDNLKRWLPPQGARDWAGPRDLSGVVRTAWDEAGFYLAVEVTDDALDLEAGRKKDNWFMRDSLQVYFDTWADARFRAERGFDNNDYAYDFALTGAGPQAYRRTVPEWQIAFLKTGAPEGVQTAIARRGEKTVYEIFFPTREIVPIEMRSGTSFGFAILVNDKDNDYRKHGLTLTPAGTEPHMNPHLYPVWVLAD